MEVEEEVEEEEGQAVGCRIGVTMATSPMRNFFIAPVDFCHFIDYLPGENGVSTLARDKSF